MKNLNKKIAEQVIFLCGRGNHQLGKKVLEKISELFGHKCTFEHISYGEYIEGELDNRIPEYEKIRGKVVVIYQSMSAPDLVEEALDFIWACKHQYGAIYVILICPFLWNRRQDALMEILKGEFEKKEAKPEEIQRLRKIISFLANAGVNEMMVATPHSKAMEEYCTQYGIKFHEIDPSPIFASMVQTIVPIEDQKLINVYSPDLGSINRAVKLARVLNCHILFNEKKRGINRETSIVESKSDEIASLTKKLREKYDFPEINYATPEEINGKIVIITEDEVASGGTANDTGKRLVSFEAKMLFLLATHPVLTLGWKGRLFSKNPFDYVIMADSIERDIKKRTGGKIIDISLDSLFAAETYRLLNKIII